MQILRLPHTTTASAVTAAVAAAATATPGLPVHYFRCPFCSLLHVSTLYATIRRVLFSSFLIMTIYFPAQAARGFCPQRPS